MKPLSNQQIVGGVNRKENRAMRHACDLWWGDVYSIIYKLIHGSPETEDLTAEVFIKLFRTDRRFETLDEIRAFLFRTAKNRTVDWLRHEQVKKAGFIEINYRYPTVEEQDLEQTETHAALSRLIDEAVENLSRQCRNVFRLWYTEGLDNGEIAKRLGLSEKTVANQKTLALSKLKMEVGPRGRSLFFISIII